MKSFVMYASCGEYSDTQVWVVASFVDEELARAHKREIEMELSRLRALFSVLLEHGTDVGDYLWCDDKMTTVHTVNRLRTRRGETMSHSEHVPTTLFRLGMFTHQPNGFYFNTTLDVVEVEHWGLG